MRADRDRAPPIGASRVIPGGTDRKKNARPLAQSVIREDLVM
jgi:hypothetical protein